MKPQASAPPRYKGRFAPSPTGLLHLGSLTAALGSFLDAKANDGEWLLRIEDIDPPREQEGAKDAIPRQLELHGLEWDGEICFQSDRSEIYQNYLDQLTTSGAAYRCSCSRQQIRQMGAVYNGKCFNNPPDPDTEAALRLKIPNAFSWEDLIQGPTSFDAQNLGGDFIVHRKDGLFSYQLAVAVDDHLQGVTRVVRGLDLLDSTARQGLIMQTLGWQIPEYAHLPMVMGQDGHKLSKQTHAPILGSSQVVDNIRRALQILGLNPPKEISLGERDELIQWAIASWNLSTVPSGMRPAYP